MNWELFSLSALGYNTIKNLVELPGRNQFQLEKLKLAQQTYSDIQHPWSVGVLTCIHVLFEIWITGNICTTYNSMESLLLIQMKHDCFNIRIKELTSGSGLTNIHCCRAWSGFSWDMLEWVKGWMSCQLIWYIYSLFLLSYLLPPVCDDLGVLSFQYGCITRCLLSHVTLQSEYHACTSE